MFFRLALLGFLSQSTTALPAFQSGSNAGSLYAAGIIKDDDSGKIFVTGITYDLSIDASSGASSVPTDSSSCFVAELTDDASSKTFDTENIVVYGSSNYDEACRAIAILSDTQLVVVGNSDQGGLYAELSSKPQVGFGMTIGRSDLKAISGKSLLVNTQVPYPQAVVVDPTDSDVFYVASMVSKEDTTSSVNDERFPNWTREFKHGAFFEMTVERIQYNSNNAGSTFNGILDGATQADSLQTLWSHYFPIDTTESDTSAESASKSVFVGGMIYKQDVGLIVVGSTASIGEGYGPADGDDEDGYVTILNPTTGELASDRKNNERFGTEEYDIVTSVCDDPNDPDYFYVVGATRGNMDDITESQPDDITIPDGSLQAFVRKVYVGDLFSEWTIQLGAVNGNFETATTALGCVVSDGVVYVAGVVTDGASMVWGSASLPSFGGDDMWVAELDLEDAEIYWMKQVGSDGDESLARGGGITTDADGNAVVFGDTNGGLYRYVTEYINSDLFGITFNYDDGSYLPTLADGTPVPTTSPTKAPVVAPTRAPVVAPTPAPVAAPTPAPTVNGPVPAAYSKSKRIHQSGPNSGALYASGLGLITETNEVIISGISYTKSNGAVSPEASCLLARIEVSAMNTLAVNIMGDPDVLEVCRSVAITHDGSTAVVVGNADKGGMFADDVDVQAGFGMTISTDDLSANVGNSLFSEKIPYPKNVIIEGSDVYVASVTSNDVAENSNSNAGDFPNWTFLNKYGTSFVMTIERLSLSNMQSVWSKTYPVETEVGGETHSVYVGGIISMLHSTLLVAVGATKAKGDAYGPAEGDDEDGFITVLDTTTGELASDRKNNIRIGSHQDDVIANICSIPSHPNFFIVVGATRGDMGGIQDEDLSPASGSLSWFVMKVSLETLAADWVYQGGAILEGTTTSTSAYALGCHVSGNVVYVGGTVENGAGMVVGTEIQKSAGGDDVFVAQLEQLTGTLNWLTQFGSSGDDHLSRKGGIIADTYGNALIYGDTTGALVRDRVIGSNTDIFLAVLDFATGDIEDMGTEAPVAQPVAPTPQPVVPPTPRPTPVPVQSGGTTDEGEIIPDDIVAIQLGPDIGPTYAGGMAFEPATDSIYLTGATYGAFSGPGVHAATYSACFFARLDLPVMEVIQRDTYGVSSTTDACNAIVSNDYGNKRNAIIIGSTQPGGLMTELTTTSALQYGFAMDLSQEAKFEYLGGTMIGDARVTFPVAIVEEKRQFWTVSRTSSSVEVSADLSMVQNTDYPNFTNGGVQLFSSDYNVNIECFEITKAGDGNPFSQGASQTYESAWRLELDASGVDSLFATGMVSYGGNLMVVGTASSDGAKYGFMQVVLKSEQTADSLNFLQATNGDAWILNVCNDEDDSSVFYVVGATNGILDTSVDRSASAVTVDAFVAKIDSSTYTPLWTKQFTVLHADGGTSTKAAAYAFGCDMLSTENIVYVAGTVESGATMQDAGSDISSAGRDDIFVVQLSTDDGHINWMKQVGSNGDDRVARGGGIKVDSSGNAVVYGDTTGSFFRLRTDDINPLFSDPFVLILGKQYGTHQAPLEGIALPSSKNNTARAIGLAVVVLGLLCALCCAYRFCCRRNMKEKNIYDASTPFDDQVEVGGGQRNLGGYSDNPNGGLLYSDPLGDGSPSKYSDLPRNGKEII